MDAPALPAEISVAAFEQLHDKPAAWQGVVSSIAARYSSQPLRLMSEGTVLVALVGTDLAVKLYPPFLRDHFDFECAALQALSGCLSVPTPTLRATGDHQGWPYLVMSQLAGDGLVPVWPLLSPAEQCRILASLGSLVREVHALPVAPLQAWAPAWPAFLARQRQGCLARQQRTGLPAHLLAQVADFLEGELPTGPDVILTGEYTPMNLLVRGAQLVGMYDFGDGLVGPREYDWLGPLCFLAAGRSGHCRAFFDGYGVSPSPAQRQALLRLLLLHRYSNLQAQLAVADWQQAPSFEALTARVWPC